MIIHQETNSRANYNYNAYLYQNCSWYHHFHKNFELIYVISGEVDAMIDQRTEKLYAGDFALILPSQIHAYQTPDNSCAWVGVFSEDFVREFSKQMNEKQGEISKFNCDADILNYLLKKLIHEDRPSIYTLKSCLYAVCDQYAKHIQVINRVTNHDTFIYKILDYISKHFTEELTMSEISRNLGYEYHYVSRCFHNAFHVNFRQFVNQYRFDYAKNLITETDMDITTIAMKSGFQSIRNFNRVFKEITGTEPRNYLKTDEMSRISVSYQ